MAYDRVDRVLDRHEAIDGVVGEVDVEPPAELLGQLHDRERVGAELLEAGLGHDSIGGTADDTNEDVRELFVD